MYIFVTRLWMLIRFYSVLINVKYYDIDTSERFYLKSIKIIQMVLKYRELFIIKI